MLALKGYLGSFEVQNLRLKHSSDETSHEEVVQGFKYQSTVSRAGGQSVRRLVSTREGKAFVGAGDRQEAGVEAEGITQQGQEGGGGGGQEEEALGVAGVEKEGQFPTPANKLLPKQQDRAEAFSPVFLRDLAEGQCIGACDGMTGIYAVSSNTSAQRLHLDNKVQV